MQRICRKTRTIIARKPRQTAAGSVCRQLTGPSWTKRQWETSWAHKRGLHSQRQWFPCQRDLCWESPPFKRFPSRTSATEGLVGIGEGISCGWQMKMQLCRSKMKTVWAESPRAAATAPCMDLRQSFTLWYFDYGVVWSIQLLYSMLRTVLLCCFRAPLLMLIIILHVIIFNRGRKQGLPSLLAAHEAD